MSVLDENINPNVKLGDYYAVTLFWQVFRIREYEQVEPVMLPCDLVQLHQSGPPHKDIRSIAHVEPEIQDHDQPLIMIMSLPADTTDEELEEQLRLEVSNQFRTQFVNIIKCSSYSDNYYYMVQIAKPLDNCGHPMLLNGNPYIYFNKKV